MKRANVLLLSLLTLTLVSYRCNKEAQQEEPLLTAKEGGTFLGKLVKKGICGQRVIQVVSNVNGAFVINSKWKDTSSGKEYEDVFAVENRCDFPSAIKEGDTFTFQIAKAKITNCALCEAYTEEPPQKNAIIVVPDTK